MTALNIFTSEALGSSRNPIEITPPSAIRESNNFILDTVFIEVPYDDTHQPLPPTDEDLSDNSSHNHAYVVQSLRRTNREVFFQTNFQKAVVFHSIHGEKINVVALAKWPKLSPAPLIECSLKWLTPTVTLNVFFRIQ